MSNVDVFLRHTIIRDLENHRIVIPNSVISGEVLINLHLGDNRVCKIIDIGVSYNADINLAMQIIKEEILKHPLHVDPRSHEELEYGKEEVNVKVVGLGSSSVNLRTWAWASNTPNGFIMQCDLFKSIKEQFDARGIEIPYEYQNVIIKKES